MTSKEKTLICSYPISISYRIYCWIENTKYRDIGWIYNPYGKCWTHHFHTIKQREDFIKYIQKNYKE